MAQKSLHTTTVNELAMTQKKSISSRWNSFAKKEGGNVLKLFAYGDELYEEVFSLK